jgi:hypothetical protein
MRAAYPGPYARNRLTSCGRWSARAMTVNGMYPWTPRERQGRSAPACSVVDRYRSGAAVH